MTLSGLSQRNQTAWRLLLAAACGARAIRKIACRDAQSKSDGTPVTEADLASDRAIHRALARHCPGVAVVSEEHHQTNPEDHYLLVDPLDGTREFMANTGEFAVCIAEIHNERPTAGVILAPDQHVAWLAGETAMRVELSVDLRPKPSTLTPLPKPNAPPRSYITSRFHLDEATRRFGTRHPDWSATTIGAALKFGALVEGRARLYPRGAGPQIWDVAAGEALLLACGGLVLGVDGHPIRYRSEGPSYVVGGFVAGTDPNEVRAIASEWT